MNRDTARQTAVLLVTVLVATSTMVVGVSAGVPETTGDVAVEASDVSAETVEANGGSLVESTGTSTGAVQTSGDDEIEPADTIYVRENGDAVIVYENSSGDANTEFGLDVSSNVFYALVEGPVETETDSRVDLTAVITPDRLRANGTLRAPRTGDLEAVEDFSADLEGITTDQRNRFDASTSVTINNTEAETARIVETASVSGNFSTTPTRFRTATEFQSTLLSPIGPERHEQFTLTETDGEYTVDASRDYIVSDILVDSYDTRSEAKQTIQAQFGSAAQQFGGEATVTIQSYSFNSDTNRLDIEFTIVYTGVEQGLADSIGAQLAASEEIDLNESQIETFKTRFQRLNINEVSTRVDQEGTSVSGYFRLDLKNYDEWVRAGLTIAEAAEPESETITQSDIDRARDRLEAQEAANFRQRFEYSASLDQPSTERTVASADLQYRTTNWAAFVDELGTRGVTAVDREYNLTGRTEGDDIVLEGFLEVSGRDVIERSFDDTFNRTDTEMTRFGRALRNAELEKAKFDVLLTEGEFRLEAGAKFNNLSEARDALAETTDVPRFTSVVGRTEGDTVRSYVFIENAVESGATENDVRALPYVDSETQVNMPNTWDREFPSVDTQRAAEFLDVSLEPGDGDDEPGEGATVTLQPASTRAETGGTATYDIVASGIDSGVGSYDIVVNVSDTSRARITSATTAINGAGETNVAGDGSGVKIGSFNGDTSDTGPVTVGTVTVEGVATGNVDLTVTTNSLSDESGTQYTVSSSSGATLSVVDEIVAPEVVPGSPARDPDEDGLYEDVNGDGSTSPGDATVLFNAIFDDNPAVTDNVDKFDFNDDGGVSPGDATVLFEEIFGG